MNLKNVFIFIFLFFLFCLSDPLSAHHDKAVDIDVRSDGTSSFSNQGFLLSQILFLGLGCGNGTIVGQYFFHELTNFVNEEFDFPK